MKKVPLSKTMWSCVFFCAVCMKWESSLLSSWNIRRQKHNSNINVNSRWMQIEHVPSPLFSGSGPYQRVGWHVFPSWVNESKSWQRHQAKENLDTVSWNFMEMMTVSKAVSSVIALMTGASIRWLFLIISIRLWNTTEIISLVIIWWYISSFRVPK